MKIAYCIPSCHKSGGMERVLSIKANYLADVLHWDVSIITTESWDGERHFHFSEKIKFHCLNINYMENTSTLYSILHRSKYKKQHKKALTQLLLNEGFDICVSMFCHEMTFLASIKDGSHKVLELHFCKDFRYLDQLYNKKNIFIRTLGKILTSFERHHIKRYDAFVVLSQEDADNWGTKYNCKVISNPAIIEYRGEPDYSNKRAIGVGRLCPQKGFDLLLDIWSKIPLSVREGWELHLFGSGETEKLNNQIQTLGLQQQVHLRGSTNDIAQELKKASIFCFPSRYEGFSMALAEGMLAGLPAVSFACPSGPTDIITHGVTGYCVPIDDMHAFSECLQNLMQSQDLRYKIGSSARSSVKINYDLHKIMNQWIDLFNTITNKNQ